ncbi:MAG: metalloregulator ArsR/SmtB family transcription factor [Saprospiraceae bacterium]|nr:metalloregulator ArsR/SmtB family transcription factor [Saprospiraceae bacterium]
MAKKSSGNLAEGRKILRALNHKLRLKLIKYIDKNKGTFVKKMYKDLKLEQSVTSQHLRILREAGIVTTQREGKNIRYFIDYDRVKFIIKRVDDFLD